MKIYRKKWMTALFAVLILVSGPMVKTVQAAEYAPIDLRNATYTIEASVTMEDGGGQIQTPTSIFVKEKKATAVISWDSPEYAYMIVGGEEILPKSREGGSVFWIPVTDWEHEMEIVVGKGYSDIEELSCSLYLNTETIKKQGNNGPLYVLIVLNIILAFLNALNMIRKKKLYAERVETKEEAEKFAKQLERKPMQAPQPQKRLVLDENGNFVTEDVFESAKAYKAETYGNAAPPTPPQDAPAPQLWWRRTGEETLIIDRKNDDYKVKEIRPVKKVEEEKKENHEGAENNDNRVSSEQ